MPSYPFYVFDAYGTLFDVHSAASKHQAELGPAWERLSQTWRLKHIEYTWVWAQTGRHTSFRQLADQSLDYAIALVGGVPVGVRDKLMASYMTLSAYPEVVEVLGGLRAKGARTAILSNGDPDMLDAAVSSAGIGAHLDAVLSVKDAGIFKPAMKVYELATRHFACKPRDISFQSSNRWDAAGATVFGMRCVWINRSALPDEYPDTPADVVTQDLRALLRDG